MLFANLLHITCTLAIYVGLCLLPYFDVFKVKGQTLDDYNPVAFAGPLYYRERPVILERPIYLTPPKVFVPNAQSPYQPTDLLSINGQSLYASYRPSETPYDRDLEFGTERRRRTRRGRRRRRRRRRRRYG